jgi:ferrochelatase
VDAVVFTAHSLPRRAIEEGDPYAEQVKETAAGVAARAGLSSWEQAWQSAGRTPEPWLGPSLEERLAALAAEGRSRVLVAPIGFVCDHTEVLFDIDVQARAFALGRGMALRRTESLNTSPAFIGALEAVVRRAFSV